MRHGESILQSVLKVSIHASVKDATTGYAEDGYPIGVSIHASVKDATLKFRLILSALTFQSTHL